MASSESRLIFAENSAKRSDHLILQLTFLLKKRKIYTTYLKNIFNEISSKNVFIQLGKNCWRFVFFYFFTIDFHIIYNGKAYIFFLSQSVY